MILDDIRRDWTAARKARDTHRATLLGTLVGAITNKEKTFNPMRPAMDAEVVSEVKKMLDGIIETGRVLENVQGRETDREKVAIERQILEAYMPQQMNESEIEAFVLSKQTEGASLGQIMSALKAEHPGKYDGRLASAIAKRMIG